MGEVRSFNSKKENQKAFYAKRTKDTEYLKVELNQIDHIWIAFVLLPGLKPAQKNQFGYLRST